MVLALIAVQASFFRACPVTEHPVTDSSPSLCVSGFEFRFKDDKCRGQFIEAPAAHIVRGLSGRGPNGASYFEKRGAVLGVSFFDPVARKSMILSRDGHIRQADIEAVENWQVVDGFAYPLAKRSVRLFRQNLKGYLEEPKRFSLWCPVMRKEIASIERAVGYVDRDGTRFFLCCESCMGSAPADRDGQGWGEARAKAKPWLSLRSEPTGQSSRRYRRSNSFER